MWVYPDLLMDKQWPLAKSTKPKAKQRSCNAISAVPDEGVETTSLSSSENKQLAFTMQPAQISGTHGEKEYLKKYSKTTATLPKQGKEVAEQTQVKELRYSKALRKDAPKSSKDSFRFDVLAQLANIPARITLFELLRESDEVKTVVAEKQPFKGVENYFTNSNHYLDSEPFEVPLIEEPDSSNEADTESEHEQGLVFNDIEPVVIGLENLDVNDLVYEDSGVIFNNNDDLAYLSRVELNHNMSGESDDDSCTSSSKSSCWESDISIRTVFRALMANMTSASPMENQEDDQLPLFDDPLSRQVGIQWEHRFEQRESPTDDKVIQVNMGDEINQKPIFISDSLSPEEKEDLITLI
ncbi:uncharacterized protein A4U43_C01F19510 [Asparagus officinalis]|uniref:Uncharacterized protein n=1 Tax=Asparagus officinalis TaxID=4686 RepID=A0A5P1FQV9_ASPOF|nr:uncharacterized protein A4U43_C01F19510 [Asparagus officinalis]